MFYCEALEPIRDCDFLILIGGKKAKIVLCEQLKLKGI